MRSADNVDTSALLLEQVSQALQYATPLRIQGANSKAFLGRSVAGEVLDTRGHRGIVSYDPTELVITARCGTPLMELAQALDKAGQMPGLRTALFRCRHGRRHGCQRPVGAAPALVRFAQGLCPRHPGDHRARQAFAFWRRSHEKRRWL